MSTKRQVIDSLRNKLRERNADSNYSNQFLYQTLLEQAKWLIKRELSSGKFYNNVEFFQTLGCQNVIEVPTIDPCCPIKTNCKIYRTECKIPKVWSDGTGPLIRNVTSVDGSTDFWITTPTTWQNKKVDPYQKMSSVKYTFFANGYYWFPDYNPHKVNLVGFWEDDVAVLDGCSDTKDCVRFLDTPFKVPHWLEAEMMSKALELLAGVSKRLQEDEQIDKNPTRKS